MFSFSSPPAPPPSEVLRLKSYGHRIRIRDCDMIQEQESFSGRNNAELLRTGELTGMLAF